MDVAPCGAMPSSSGARRTRSPLRQDPDPSSATQATSCTGCQIQARTVAPPRVSATMTAWSGEPWTKFFVPSIGSTVNAWSAVR